MRADLIRSANYSLSAPALLAGSFDYDAIVKAAESNKKAAEAAYTRKGCTGSEPADSECGLLRADVAAAAEAEVDASEGAGGKGGGGGGIGPGAIGGIVGGVLACCVFFGIVACMVTRQAGPR